MAVCPCKPDCADRSCRCHVTCSKYVAYEIFRNIEYEQRDRERRDKAYLDRVSTRQNNFTHNYNVHRIKGR